VDTGFYQFFNTFSFESSEQDIVRSKFIPQMTLAQLHGHKNYYVRYQQVNLAPERI